MTSFCLQTDGRTDRRTDGRTDIRTYIAAFAAENIMNVLNSYFIFELDLNFKHLELSFHFSDPEEKFIKYPRISTRFDNLKSFYLLSKKY